MVKIRSEKISLFLLSVPGIALLAIFVLGSFGWAICISFTDQTLLGEASLHTQFIGLKNWGKLFTDPLFRNSLSFTFIFTMGSAVIGQSLLGLALATLLQQKFLGKNILFVTVFIAWVIPEMVAAYMWNSLFSYQYGFLNSILQAMGFASRSWLFDSPLISVIIANIWRGTAFSLMLMSAAIETIPRDYYEAAKMDGASNWQEFRWITLPLITFAIILNILLVIIQTIPVFTLVFALTGGGPSFKTELASIYIYRTSFRYLELASGCAASLFLTIICVLFTSLYFRLQRRTS